MSKTLCTLWLCSQDPVVITLVMVLVQEVEDLEAEMAPEEEEVAEDEVITSVSTAEDQPIFLRSVSTLTTTNCPRTTSGSGLSHSTTNGGLPHGLPSLVQF